MNALQFLESHKGHSDIINTERYPYPVLIPRFLSYGDYDNSCFVERSNVELFLKSYGSLVGVHRISGAHGYTAVALLIEALENTEIIETLAALESYPCLDDEHYYSLEWKSYLEYWDSDGNTDFINALAKAHNLKSATVNFLESMNSDILRLIYERNHPTGTYFETQAGDSVWIDFKEGIKNIDRATLAQAIKAWRV